MDTNFENVNVTEADIQNDTKNTQNKRTRRYRITPERNFPVYSIKECLVIAEKIKELNGGNPWSPNEIAAAISMNKGSNSFFYLTAAARDYGITQGTCRASIVQLGDIGRGIVYAKSNDEEHDFVSKAFSSVKLFKDVFEYYKGKQLPELKYLNNTFETHFKIPTEYHEEFYTVYQKNVEYINSYEAEVSGIIRAVATEAVRDKPQQLAAKRASMQAFVIMPFSEKTQMYQKGFFSEAYTNLIYPAGQSAGFSVRTARRGGSDIIQSTIVNDIETADIIIVDLTEHNPNVLFELGLAIAFEKSVALIRASGTGQIFDVDNMLRVFDYNPNLWKSTIEVDLPKLTEHIKATWENKGVLQSYLSILRKQRN